MKYLFIMLMILLPIVGCAPEPGDPSLPPCCQPGVDCPYGICPVPNTAL